MSSYDSLDVHRIMLEDEVRTRAFERAIAEVVRPGDRVLDFGCGTGILAFFAARAGAARVYAVDCSPIVRAARAIAKQNGFQSIEFFETDGGVPALPGPVDVIVSEWLGHFAFQERMLAPLLAIRDRSLVRSGILVPSRITLWAALVCDPAAHERIGYFRRRPYGIDFGPIADWPFWETEARPVDPARLVTPPVCVGTVDLATCQAIPPMLGATVVAERDGESHGIVGWFDVELSPSVHFSTGPASPPTHWRQTFFPTSRPFALRAGRPVRLVIEPLALDPNARGSFWRWTLDDGADRIEMNDLQFRTWLTSDEPDVPSPVETGGVERRGVR